MFVKLMLTEIMPILTFCKTKQQQPVNRQKCPFKKIHIHFFNMSGELQKVTARSSLLSRTQRFPGSKARLQWEEPDRGLTPPTYRRTRVLTAELHLDLVLLLLWDL